MIALIYVTAVTAALVYIIMMRGRYDEWRIYVAFSALYALGILLASFTIVAPAGQECRVTCENTATGQTCTELCNTVYATDYSAYAALVVSATLSVVSIMLAAVFGAYSLLRV